MKVARTRNVAGTFAFVASIAVLGLLGSFSRVSAGTIMEYFDGAKWQTIASSPSPSTFVSSFNTTTKFNLMGASAARRRISHIDVYD